MKKTLPKSVFDEEESDELFLEKEETSQAVTEKSSKSSFPQLNEFFEIDFFPLKLKFQPCFPNSTSKKKVIITNSGNQTETFNLSISGSFYFSIKQKSISINPGESESIIVYYNPSDEGNHKANLEISGRKNFKIPVSGKCLSTTIEIPKQSDQCWTFSIPNKFINKIPVTNRSFTKTLRVDIETNDLSYRISHSTIDIAPATTKDVLVTYDASSQSEKNSLFILKCEEENIRIERSFNLIKSKSSVIINFGTVAVNTQANKELTVCGSTELVVSPKTPFAYSVSGKTLFFSFQPQTIGTFTEVAALPNLDIILKGESVTPPFAFDPKTGRMINTSNEKIKVLINPVTKGLKVRSSVLEIEPNESADIQLNKSSVVADTSVVEVSCGKMKSTLSICGNDEEDEEHVQKEDKTPTVLDLSLSANMSMRRSILQNTRQGSFSYSKRVIEENTEVDEEIEITPSFVFFPNVCVNIDVEATIKITCDSYFSIEGPQWIKFPKNIESGKELVLKCSELKERECASHIIVETSDNTPIPVFAYSGKSNLEFKKDVKLSYKGRNQYSGELSVTNTGNRSSFLLFTSPKDDIRIAVLPSDAFIIEPGKTEVISFNIISPFVAKLKVPIVAYSGDEIIRQMRNYFTKNDIMFTAFKDVKTENEISAFKDGLSGLEDDDFDDVFKKNISITSITLLSILTEKKSMDVVPSPTSILLKGNEALAHFSLLNMSSNDIGFDVEANESFTVSPKTGVVLKYAETQFTVHVLDLNEQSNILISTSEGLIKIPISVSTQKATLHKAKTFSIKSSIVDFGNCEVGKTKNIVLNITNLTASEQVLKIRRSTTKHFKLFSVPYSVTLSPLAISELKLSFSPMKEKEYEEKVVIESDNDSSELTLSGKGIKEHNKGIISVSPKSINFSICETGETVRKIVKVTNKSTRREQIDIHTEAPFSCSCKSMEIDANSYDTFTVSFMSQEEGDFKSSIELSISSHRVALIPLKGRSIVAEI